MNYPDKYMFKKEFLDSPEYKDAIARSKAAMNKRGPFLSFSFYSGCMNCGGNVHVTPDRKVPDGFKFGGYECRTCDRCGVPNSGWRGWTDHERALSFLGPSIWRNNLLSLQDFFRN